MAGQSKGHVLDFTWEFGERVMQTGKLTTMLSIFILRFSTVGSRIKTPNLFALFHRFSPVVDFGVLTCATLNKSLNQKAGSLKDQRGELEDIPGIFSSMAKLATGNTGRERIVADGYFFVNHGVSECIRALGHSTNEHTDTLLRAN